MIVPFFLDTPEGALHVSLHMPPDARPASGWVVHVPAFAEEMNKSRAMVSRQARALAATARQPVRGPGSRSRHRPRERPRASHF